MRKGSVRGALWKSPKSLGPEMRSGGEGSWADGPEDGVRMEKHSEVAKVDGLDVRQNIGRNSKNTLNTDRRGNGACWRWILSGQSLLAPCAGQKKPRHDQGREGRESTASDRKTRDKRHRTAYGLAPLWPLWRANCNEWWYYDAMLSSCLFRWTCVLPSLLH